jgi:tetratricopeptide (TPR) repeat protein
LHEKFEKEGGILVLSVELGGFSHEESQTYIAEKQQFLKVTIKQEWSDKLIVLSEGKPIFLDLAIEWFAQEADIDWLMKLNITDEITYETKQGFEGKIISKIRELKYPIDWVVFVLAHIYPLDKEGFEILFAEDEEIKYKFEDVEKMVFTKSLPGGEIKLHDEVQRIVSEHIIDTIDNQLLRRQYYSQKIIHHLQNRLKHKENEFEKKLAAFKEKGENDIDLKLEIAERETVLNELTNQLIIHSFFANPSEGKHKLHNRIQELTSGRWTKQEVDTLLQGLGGFLKANPLSNDIDFVLDLTRLQLYAEKSQELEEFKDKASNEQKIEIYLLESNDLVRRGENSDSILLLQQAEQLNNEIDNNYNKIRLDIELGWNYRLIGDLKAAKDRYEKAIQSIIREKGKDDWEQHRDLAIHYGWTQNNLAFVLSDANATRREAVHYARSAIYHWSKINHVLGLGAGHSVLGITFYRIDKPEQALEEFEKALKIFEELGLFQWICQVYSWRGAIYQDRNGPGDLKKAREELDLALDLASKHYKQIIPMTLNRLGRVYMSLQKWDLALKHMLESLKQAKLLPDYVYWLGSIGRLGYVIAEYPKSNIDLEFLWREFNEFRSITKEKGISPEKNSLGITQLALARLELRLLSKHYTSKKFDLVMNLLRESIPLITEHGSYARTDIESRLTHFEKEFPNINSDIIQNIGDGLYDFIVNKTKTEYGSSYYIVLEKISDWKNY